MKVEVDDFAVRTCLPWLTSEDILMFLTTLIVFGQLLCGTLASNQGVLTLNKVSAPFFRTWLTGSPCVATVTED